MSRRASGGTGVAVGDISELQRVAGTQHAVDLGEHSALVGAQVDGPIGDDDVRPAITDRQSLGERLAEFDVAKTQRLGGGLCLGDHLGRHVDADHVTAGADLAGGDQHVESGAGADAENVLAGL